MSSTLLDQGKPVRNGRVMLPVGTVCVVQLMHDRRFVVFNHFKVIEVEPLVERLIEQSPSCVVGALVELLRVRSQVQRIVQDLRTGGEFGAGLGQACFCSFTLNLNIEQFGTDLRLRHRAEAHESD
ncbi:hypothetical protein C5E45_29395 [Nocardia nova]|uniref:Uncharacterized protein n=1 Tax=Nocardia nova TaxID=37330 RepID=A0A2S6AHQ8_9NOCA|nr:hypothetical protein [Nocardia nova]PPJ23151.1 hypothetical protein C5E41_25525 [Nocardia nova]PPJ34761.1 hypothetical protein C5E45_29395 [Nocardia nova]